MDKKLLTAQELADALNLSVETVWRYTRENTIPAVKLGKRQYRYDKEAVISALTSGVRESGPVYEPQGKVTYEQYAQLPEEPGYSYELIDGVLIKEPSPIIHHQRVSRRLQRILEDYFAETDPTGEVFNAPLDVVLSEYTVVQPDLIYIADMEALKSSKFIDDLAPRLVVEVLSKSSGRRDRVQKLDLYRRYGILHYWIVDPHEGMIEAFKLMDGNYARYAGADRMFEHPDFPGLSFDISEVCDDPQKNRS